MIDASSSSGGLSAAWAEAQQRLTAVAAGIVQQYVDYRDFFDQLYITALRGLCIGSVAAWLLSWDWFCDISLLTTALLAGLLLGTTRELQLRRSLESSVSSIKLENEKLVLANTGLMANVSSLEQTSAELERTTAGLQSDLNLLQDTIGIVGEMSSQWLGQLRDLSQQHRRENDRQAGLLKGQARIIMLQLIQQFDVNRDLKLDRDELRNAEPALHAAFPHIDVASLEGKAGSSGVTLADLEPLLLAGLGTTPRLTFTDGASGTVPSPARSPPRPKLLSLSGTLNALSSRNFATSAGLSA